MPQTESCTLGTENKGRIDNLEQSLARIEKAIEKISNHYSKRPSWFIAIFITALTNAITLLSMYIITQ